MMHRSLVVALLLAACSGEIEGADDAVGQAEQDVTSTNSLQVNSLQVNSLQVNSLQVNSLSVYYQGVWTADRLSDSCPNYVCELTQSWKSWIGSDWRRNQLMQYIGKCAMGGYKLHWTYNGVSQLWPPANQSGVGIAQNWSTYPLDAWRQERVSSCLMAHVNAYGTPVGISVRGPNSTPLPNFSAADPGYTYQEAAFYGNLFLATPRKYVCGGKKQNAPGYYSPERLLRICGLPDANGVSACGFTVTGTCDQVCGSYSGGVYWGCWGGNVSWGQPVTTYLYSEPVYDDDPVSSNRCGGPCPV